MIFASLLFGRYPFFQGANVSDQLGDIVSVLGSDELLKINLKYGLGIPEHLQFVQFKKTHWDSFVNEQNKSLSSTEALDLLQKLLCFDFQNRISARDALGHKYFQ